MKRLLFFFAIVSVIETANAQTPAIQVVSSRTDYTELIGDQVITRAYKGAYKLTHFRHEDDDYWHSFVIHGLTDTKRFEFRINVNGLTDTLYKLNVNDMRIEGDSCYFCGNVVHVGPPVMTPQGNIVWPERDSVGFVGFFSITELLSGQVRLRYSFFYDVYDLTRLATVTYPQRTSWRLMVAAIGTLTDQTTPCVLELKTNGTTWKKSLGYPNSGDEVFSDILYNPYRLVIASYRRCNGDDGAYQNEPNHWKFTLHYASDYGFCSDYSPMFNSETAAEYNTYGLTVDHITGWHTSDAQLRLCRLAAGRMCMAYGTKNINNHTAVVLFSMPNEPLSADTITYFINGAYRPAVVYDMVGLPYDNSVAVVASGGFNPNEDEDWLFFPTISTSLSWIQYVNMYGVIKRTVDRWNTHTAITGGYQSVNGNNIIVTQLQDKTTLSPTEPFPITCFMGGLASYNAVGSLDAEKEEYDWSTVYMESDLTWTVHIYNAIAVEYENPCYKLNLHLQE